MQHDGGDSDWAKLTVHTWQFLPARVSVFENVVYVCMWHRSPPIHRCSKSVGSPAAWQIGTPDLSLCQPLICPPRRAIILPTTAARPLHPTLPLPTCADRWRLRWGVLDLRCTASPCGTGSDRIRLDSLCVRLSRKELQVSERLFDFSSSECSKSHHTLFGVQTFSST